MKDPEGAKGSTPAASSGLLHLNTPLNTMYNTMSTGPNNRLHLTANTITMEQVISMTWVTSMT